MPTLTLIPLLLRYISEKLSKRQVMISPADLSHRSGHYSAYDASYADQVSWRLVTGDINNEMKKESLRVADTGQWQRYL